MRLSSIIFLFFTKKGRTICPPQIGLKFDIQLGNHGSTTGAEVICTGGFGVHPTTGALCTLGFADSNGKARNFTMFFPKNKELAIGFWWVPQNQEYEAWFAEVNLPCKFLQNTGGQYWYDISISSEALLSDAQLTVIDKMIHISLENFNSK